MPSYPLAVVAVLGVLALVAPSGATAHHRDSHEPRWEDWRPGVDVADEQADTDDEDPWLPADEPEDGAWFDELEDSGDGPPARGRPSQPPAKRPSAKRPSTSTALRGVPYRALILRYARRRKLEPALVAAVIHAESAFRPRAVSRVGARGLMQLMPATARGMGAPVSRLFDPATNILYGTLYLSHVRRLVGADVRRMAAAYNAGPGAVRRFGGVPPYTETRTYVRRVTALRDRYRAR